jgi:mRNA-degrading endonuclease toxin of MazEF toxin-antitoxin module
MSLNRGDVALARFPHTAGARGKKRPVVVVQADHYNQLLRHVVVAEVTKNLSNLADPACLHIDLSTPDGKATGLLHDSLVSCILLATFDADRVTPVIGKLSPGLLQSLDVCLKAALGLRSLTFPAQARGSSADPDTGSC